MDDDSFWRRVGEVNNWCFPWVAPPGTAGASSSSSSDVISTQNPLSSCDGDDGGGADRVCAVCDGSAGVLVRCCHNHHLYTRSIRTTTTAQVSAVASANNSGAPPSDEFSEATVISPSPPGGVGEEKCRKSFHPSCAFRKKVSMRLRTVGVRVAGGSRPGSEEEREELHAFCYAHAPATALYCTCQKAYDNKKFMVCCDSCLEWFHGTCVDVDEETCPDIYYCPGCVKLRTAGAATFAQPQLVAVNKAKEDDTMEEIAAHEDLPKKMRRVQDWLVRAEAALGRSRKPTETSVRTLLKQLGGDGGEEGEEEADDDERLRPGPFGLDLVLSEIGARLRRALDGAERWRERAEAAITKAGGDSGASSNAVFLTVYRCEEQCLNGDAGDAAAAASQIPAASRVVEPQWTETFDAMQLLAPSPGSTSSPSFERSWLASDCAESERRTLTGLQADSEAIAIRPNYAVLSAVKRRIAALDWLVNEALPMLVGTPGPLTPQQLENLCSKVRAANVGEAKAGGDHRVAVCPAAAEGEFCARSLVERAHGAVAEWRRRAQSILVKNDAAGDDDESAQFCSDRANPTAQASLDELRALTRTGGPEHCGVALPELTPLHALLACGEAWASGVERLLEATEPAAVSGGVGVRVNGGNGAGVSFAETCMEHVTEQLSVEVATAVARGSALGMRLPRLHELACRHELIKWHSAATACLEKTGAGGANPTRFPSSVVETLLQHAEDANASRMSFSGPDDDAALADDNVVPLPHGALVERARRLQAALLASETVANRSQLLLDQLDEDPGCYTTSQLVSLLRELRSHRVVHDEEWMIGAYLSAKQWSADAAAMLAAGDTAERVQLSALERLALQERDLRKTPWPCSWPAESAATAEIDLPHRPLFDLSLPPLGDAEKASAEGRPIEIPHRAQSYAENVFDDCPQVLSLQRRLSSAIRCRRLAKKLLRAGFRAKAAASAAAVDGCDGGDNRGEAPLSHNEDEDEDEDEDEEMNVAPCEAALRAVLVEAETLRVTFPQEMDVKQLVSWAVEWDARAHAFLTTAKTHIDDRTDGCAVRDESLLALEAMLREAWQRGIRPRLFEQAARLGSTLSWQKRVHNLLPRQWLHGGAGTEEEKSGSASSTNDGVSVEEVRQISAMGEDIGRAVNFPDYPDRGASWADWTQTYLRAARLLEWAAEARSALFQRTEVEWLETLRQQHAELITDAQDSLVRGAASSTNEGSGGDNGSGHPPAGAANVPNLFGGSLSGAGKDEMARITATLDDAQARAAHARNLLDQQQNATPGDSSEVVTITALQTMADELAGLQVVIPQEEELRLRVRALRWVEKARGVLAVRSPLAELNRLGTELGMLQMTGELVVTASVENIDDGSVMGVVAMLRSRVDDAQAWRESVHAALPTVLRGTTRRGVAGNQRSSRATLSALKALYLEGTGSALEHVHMDEETSLAQTISAAEQWQLRAVAALCPQRGLQCARDAAAFPASDASAVIDGAEGAVSDVVMSETAEQGAPAAPEPAVSAAPAAIDGATAEGTVSDVVMSETAEQGAPAAPEPAMSAAPAATDGAAAEAATTVSDASAAGSSATQTRPSEADEADERIAASIAKSLEEIQGLLSEADVMPVSLAETEALYWLQQVLKWSQQAVYADAYIETFDSTKLSELCDEGRELLVDTDETVAATLRSLTPNSSSDAGAGDADVASESESVEQSCALRWGGATNALAARAEEVRRSILTRLVPALDWESRATKALRNPEEDTEAEGSHSLQESDDTPVASKMYLTRLVEEAASLEVTVDKVTHRSVTQYLTYLKTGLMTASLSRLIYQDDLDSESDEDLVGAEEDEQEDEDDAESESDDDGMDEAAIDDNLGEEWVAEGENEESSRSRDGKKRKHRDSNAHAEKDGKIKRRRRARCGTCDACRAVDCGECRNCLDKLKYGGENTIRRACARRGRCERRGDDPGRSSRIQAPGDSLARLETRKRKAVDDALHVRGYSTTAAERAKKPPAEVSVEPPPANLDKLCKEAVSCCTERLQKLLVHRNRAAQQWAHSSTKLADGELALKCRAAAASQKKRLRMAAARDVSSGQATNYTIPLGDAGALMTVVLAASGSSVAPSQLPRSRSELTLRDKVRLSLEEVFRKGSLRAFSEDLVATDVDLELNLTANQCVRAKVLAFDIESKLHTLYPHVDKRLIHEYKQKFRSLRYNLTDEKNPALMANVLSGQILVSDLCRMSAGELASQELKAWRAEKEAELMKDKVLSGTVPQLKKAEAGSLGTKRGSQAVLKQEPKQGKRKSIVDKVREKQQARLRQIAQEKQRTLELAKIDAETSSNEKKIVLPSIHSAPDTSDLPDATIDDDGGDEPGDDDVPFIPSPPRISSPLALQDEEDESEDEPLPDLWRPVLSDKSTDAFRLRGAGLGKSETLKIKIHATPDACVHKLFPRILKIDGRMKLPQLDAFLGQIKKGSRRRVEVVSFVPFDGDENPTYNGLCETFSTSVRAGVVNVDGKKQTQIYIVAPSSTNQIASLAKLPRAVVSTLVGIVVTYTKNSDHKDRGSHRSSSSSSGSGSGRDHKQRRESKSKSSRPRSASPRAASPKLASWPPAASAPHGASPAASPVADQQRAAAAAEAAPSGSAAPAADAAGGGFGGGALLQMLQQASQVSQQAPPPQQQQQRRRIPPAGGNYIQPRASQATAPPGYNLTSNGNPMGRGPPRGFLPPGAPPPPPNNGGNFGGAASNVAPPTWPSQRPPPPGAPFMPPQQAMQQQQQQQQQHRQPQQGNWGNGGNPQRRNRWG